MSIGCQPDLLGGVVLMEAASSCGGSACGGLQFGDYPRLLLPLGAALDACTDPSQDPKCTCDSGGGGGGWGCGSGGGMDFALDRQIMLFAEGGGPSGWSSCPSKMLDRTRPQIHTFLPESTLCQPVPGPRCVHPDTWIALYPSGRKRAADVLVGDVLLTRNADGERSGEQVVSVQQAVQPCLRIELPGGAYLRCSASHEVLVRETEGGAGTETMGVVAAERLSLDSRLLLEDGSTLAARALAREEAGPVVLLSIAGPNHCFLSGSIWSHNKSTPMPP